MCVQYWPASKGKEEVYDGITVSYTHEEQLANFVIRNFKITKEGPVSFFRLEICPQSVLICFCLLFSPCLFNIREERERREDVAPVSLHRMAFSHLCNYL